MDRIHPRSTEISDDTPSQPWDIDSIGGPYEGYTTERSAQVAWYRDLAVGAGFRSDVNVTFLYAVRPFYDTIVVAVLRFGYRHCS